MVGEYVQLTDLIVGDYGAGRHSSQPHTLVSADGEVVDFRCHGAMSGDACNCPRVYPAEDDLAE